MEFLSEYGLFVAKSATLVVAVLLVAAGLFSMARAARSHAGERLEVHNLNERLRELADTLHDEMLDAPERKRLIKARRAEEKAKRKARAKGVAPRPRVFVLDFHGDLQAHAVARDRKSVV